MEQDHIILLKQFKADLVQAVEVVFIFHAHSL